MEKILIKSFDKWPTPEQIRELKKEFIKTFDFKPKLCEFKGIEGAYSVELT